MFHREDAVWSETEITRVMRHPDITKYFPDGVFAYTCATFGARRAGYGNAESEDSLEVTKLFVGSSMAYVLQLRIAAMYFARKDFVWCVPAGDDIRQYCRQLYAVAACEGCPIRSTSECFNNNLQRKYIRTIAVPAQRELFTVPISTDFSDTDSELDADEWREDVRYWKTKIAGYTAIPPKYITPDHDMPGKGLITPVHADFTGVDEAWAARSANAVSAAETRKMHREECSNCIFSAYVVKPGVFGSPCTPWASRGCKHKRWTDEHATRYIMSTVQGILKRCHTSWTLRQIWCFAQVAGVSFKKQNPETNRQCWWTLSQVRNPASLYGDGILPLNAYVRRDSVSAYHEDALKFSSYRRLYAWLPADMQRRLDAEWAQAPATKDLLVHSKFALWLCVSSLIHGRPYTCSYKSGFAVCQPEMHHVEMSRHDTGPVEIVVMTTKETDEHRIYDFDDLFRYLKDWRGFPFMNITDEEDSALMVTRGMYFSP